MLSSSLASVSAIIFKSVPFCSIEDLALLSVMLTTAPESLLVNVAQVFAGPLLTVKPPPVTSRPSSQSRCHVMST